LARHASVFYSTPWSTPGGEVEALRRALGFKRSEKHMKEIEFKLRLRHGAQRHRRQAADDIVQSISAFALYGFPKSASFAARLEASGWLKAHHPAAFPEPLLNN
jgi:error-prone DNA polymerase